MNNLNNNNKKKLINFFQWRVTTVIISKNLEY